MNVHTWRIFVLDLVKDDLVEDFIFTGTIVQFAARFSVLEEYYKYFNRYNIKILVK